MTTEKDHGGPAFPRPCAETSQGGNYEQDGMTLRDWFAGQALSGLIAHPKNFDGEGGAFFAALSYQVADAMLEAQTEESPKTSKQALTT